jgi:hypothetical protein
VCDPFLYNIFLFLFIFRYIGYWLLGLGGLRVGIEGGFAISISKSRSPPLLVVKFQKAHTDSNREKANSLAFTND